MANAIHLTVDLGQMPADPLMGSLREGLCGLWSEGELCDVALIASDQTFLAHRPVLAAVSPSFRECLVQLSTSQSSKPEGADGHKKLVLTLGDILHPEAVQAMLDCIYKPGGTAASYNPSSEAANSDVLRLAQRFQILPLQEWASQWLMSNLSTNNVLQRLAACEEFGLTDVRDKILQQITGNPPALFALAQDPEVVKVPLVLQDLLVRVLRLLGCGEESAAPGPVPLAQPQQRRVGNKSSRPSA